MNVRLSILVLCGLVLCALVVPSYAIDYTWVGGTGSNFWYTAQNWYGNTRPPSASDTGLVFGGGDTDPYPYNDIASPFSLRKLTFASAAPVVHLVGYGLSFSTASAEANISQNSASTTTIDNALSWSGGSNALNINASGSGGLVLTGGLTTSNGTLNLKAGSVTLSANPLNTGTSGNLRVGYSAPATLTIQDNATVTVGGELDLNYQATRIGDTSTFALKTGTLNVTGATVIGAAGVKGDPSDYSAKLLQTGGTANLHAATIGYAGTSTSLYDINGGTTNTSLPSSAALEVGKLGNGWLNIHGSGVVSVTNVDDLHPGLGLIIGQDSSLATSGRVDVAGGTLSVTGNVTLGGNPVNHTKGIGTLNRSGGSLNVSGSLNVEGTATLILDASGGNSASTFSALNRSTGTTLVVMPVTNNLATTEKVSFSSVVTLTNGIIGSWAVRTLSSDTTGDYLTTTESGPYSLATAGYNCSSLQSSTASSVVDVQNSSTLATGKSAYAVKFRGGTNTQLNGVTLTVESGGAIFNGATLTGGTLAFSSQPLVYAGSSTASTIGSTIQTSADFVKFGAGTLKLSADNSTSMTGAVAINSGALRAMNGGALGSGAATVAAGASLEFDGGANAIAVGNNITLNGAGSGGSGALRNVLGNNSTTEGSILNLGSNATINVDGGGLTLNSSVLGLGYNLTKTGNNMLVLAGTSNDNFPGSLTVAGGTLRLQNSKAVGDGCDLTIKNGTTLQIQGLVDISNVSFTLSGTGTGGNGALENMQGSNSCSGSVTLAGDTLINVHSATDTLTLGGTIDGGHSMTKTGSGTLELSGGDSSFTGALTILDGALKVSSINDAGTSGPLGAATAPVMLGTGGKTGTLLYSGATTTSSRNFSLAAGGSGAFRVEQSSTNLTLSGTLGGSGTLQKSGSGTLTLSGANVYAGTTMVGDGTLTVASTGSVNGTAGILVGTGGTLTVTAGSGVQLPDSGNITLIGGSFNYQGTGATGETAGALVTQAGHGSVTTTRQSGTGTPYVSFATLSHTPGGTVNFNSTNSQVQIKSPPAMVGGIIGGYSFYNGADFAKLSTTSPYIVQQYTAYATTDRGETYSGTDNYLPGSTLSIASANRHFNTMKLTGSTGVSMSGTNPSLTLNAGGLIANNTASGTISGGTLKGSASGELVVNTLHDLSISSVIADNGGATALVETGSGELTLSGNNSYTGDTFVNGGTLHIDNANALPGTGLSIYSGSVVLDCGLNSAVKVSGLYIALPGNGFGPIRSGFAAAPAHAIALQNPPSTVPEPGTLGLLVAGLVGLAILTIRRRFGRSSERFQ